MAVAYLTGVLEDGTPLADGVPANPRAELRVPQGGTLQVFLRATSRGGVPVSPDAGTLTLTVKKQPGNQPPLAQLAGTWVPFTGPGVAVFTFTPSTLPGVEWGRYVYDVRLTNGGTVNFLVPASPLILQPAV